MKVLLASFQKTFDIHLIFFQLRATKLVL